MLFVASLVWALHAAGLWEQDLVNEGGWTLVLRLLLAATHPDLTPEFLWLTWDATLKTLAYAVCGTFFSVLLGLVGGVLSAEVWWQSTNKGGFQTCFYVVPWLAVRAGLAILRAIHEVIWGLFFINIFGLDPLVAIAAIAIPFGAITAKVFSEILDETPRQPLMALLNSGVPPLNAFAYSLLPQAFPNLLSYTFYRFECSIRSAAVLGIIGAGGLGYQILLSLQSLRYEQMWTLLIALVVLSGSTDFCSAMLRRRLGAPSRLDLNFLMRSPQNTRGGWGDGGTRREIGCTPLVPLSPCLLVPFLGAVVLVIFSFWYVKADFSKLWSLRTAQLLTKLIDGAFPPDISQISQLFTLATQTLAMSILAIAIAGVGGILLSFPAANNFLLPGGILDTGGNQNRIVAIAILFFTRLLLLFTRAIPEPIWALIFIFVLFPGILPGAIALGIHNLGILGRLMAEQIENLDERPLRSLKALGASANSALLYAVLPRTLPRFLAYILYRWEVCIRATVIVGLVGAGGLGRLLSEQLSSFDYQGVVTTLICFICLTFIVDLISASVRRALR
ncbi:MAG TPA: phosphate ABC transporter permease [Cyanobacteria bacterium UBA11049]|nr:phosphate ABC transporter permease [Cyanobacteria bacterium UBA11049]